MREFLTGDDIFSEAKMIRDRGKDISILILEGVDDCNLFDRFVHADRCVSIPAHGRENVRVAVEAAVRAQFDGLVGITDADFQRHTGILLNKLVFLTDYHDLEIMAFESRALKSLLAAYGSVDKLDTTHKGYVQKVRNTIYKAIEPLSTLRFLNEQKKWGIKFSEIDYDKSIDRKTLAIDTKKMIKSLLSKSKNVSATEKEINDEFNKGRLTNADPREVSNGHDICAALAIGLRSVFGTNDTTIASPENIASALRLAFGLECFSPTALCGTLKKWENVNQSFVIFAST